MAQAHRLRGPAFDQSEFDAARIEAIAKWRPHVERMLASCMPPPPPGALPKTLQVTLAHAADQSRDDLQLYLVEDIVVLEQPVEIAAESRTCIAQAIGMAVPIAARSEAVSRRNRVFHEELPFLVP